MIVDYTQLDQPAITLTLEQEANLNYIVCDGDTVYMRSPDLDLCCRFMHAMALKKDAIVDEASISWFRALGQHSTRVDNVLIFPRMHSQLDEPTTKGA